MPPAACSACRYALAICLCTSFGQPLGSRADGQESLVRVSPCEGGRPADHLGVAYSWRCGLIARSILCVSPSCIAGSPVLHATLRVHARG